TSRVPTTTRCSRGSSSFAKRSSTIEPPACSTSSSSTTWAKKTDPRVDLYRRQDARPGRYGHPPHPQTGRRLRSFVIGGRARPNIVVVFVLFVIALRLCIAKRALLVIESGLIQLMLMLGQRCSFRWVARTVA